MCTPRLCVASPLEPLPRLSDDLGVELWCKRDDLLPHFYGGNKVRKMMSIQEDIGRAGCNAVVTTGGAQSNHARVTALLAASRGWRAVLVLHGEAPRDGREPAGNLRLMSLAGAQIRWVEPSGIGPAMREAAEALEREGFAPYEVPGGAHCLSGALGYVEAARELARQCQDVGWYPEYVVLASGTGTTQAGLVVGFEALGWPTQVLGISVARRNPRGASVVEASCRELRRHLKLEEDRPSHFLDGWVGEGYERAAPEVLRCIRFAAEREGLVLDPTYTGKAFHALRDLVAAGTIPKGARVIFWHTGGLMNHMASPYPEASRL